MGIFVVEWSELYLVLGTVVMCEALLYLFQVWANRQPGDPLQVRSSYSSVISLVLAWVVVLVLGGAWLHESTRMVEAADYQHSQAVDLGAQLFASYCVPCHGPEGEGVIGYPLDQKYLQGDPSVDQSLYNFLATTISEGRAGYGSPTWVMRSDGYWQSETQMPAWSQTYNGPLTAYDVSALVQLIMDGRHWSDVLHYIPAGTTPVDLAQAQQKHVPSTFPASTLPQAQQLQAQQTIEQVGCLGCHTIGSGGAKIAPDITAVKTWFHGVTQAQAEQFVYNWIADPTAMGKANKRAPVYWNPNYAHDPSKGSYPYNQMEPLVGTLNLPTYMPQLRMTTQQRHLIVSYLFSLK